MVRNSVFGKDMGNEVLSQLFRGASDMSENKDTLFGELIDYNQDRAKTIKSQKWLDEIHRDEISRVRRNQKLLDNAIGLVELRLGLHTSYTRPVVILYIVLET